jgi:geranylgeranyl reductase family protein
MSLAIDFDAIVVGAGPAGSTAAEHLARAGLRVALLEEHPEVGLPNHCSGLVSPRALEIAGVPKDGVALRRYRRARIWGPGGGTLWVRSESLQAIAIERDRFDQALSRRAVDAGASLMLATKAHRFERVDGCLRVYARTPQGETQLQAPLLIGADGATSRVGRWLHRDHRSPRNHWLRHGHRFGRSRRSEVIPAEKVDITFAGRGTGDVEIFVGRDVAPGWFGWVIPTTERRATIGLGTAGANAPRSLRDCTPAFLDLVRQRFGGFAVEGVRRAPIPLGPARNFVADGVLLVGAAARQTKPTTGGGVYLGVRAAQLAAGTAIRALELGDTSRRTLAAYEQSWHRLEGHEVRVGGWLRGAFRRLSDRELDWIISVAGEPWAQEAITRLGDIDYPADLLSALLRGAGRRVLPLWGRSDPGPDHDTADRARLAHAREGAFLREEGR